MKNLVLIVSLSLLTFLKINLLAKLFEPGSFSADLAIGYPSQDCPEIIRSTYTYKTIGDHCIRADVFRLSDDTIKPAILWIHGGALIMGNREWINPQQAELYLKAGFTVISIDYRLAPETKLPQIIEDINDAYTWVRNEGPALFKIDPENIAVIGHSAGGYLSLVAGYKFDPKPKAIVSFYGYGDITGDWYTKPSEYYNQQPQVTKIEASQVIGESEISYDPGRNRGKFYLYTRQLGSWPLEVVGHSPSLNNQLFDQFCPIQNVSNDYPPTLFLHGDNDNDVPYEQSVLMAKELNKFNVDHEFVTMVGKGHGFDGAMWDPEVSEVFQKIIEFLKTHLKS